MISLNGVKVSEKMNHSTLLAKFISWAVIPNLNYSPIYALKRNYRCCYDLVSKYEKWTRKSKPSKKNLSRFERKKRKVFRELKGLSHLSLQKRILADVLMGEGMPILQIGRFYPPLALPTKEADLFALIKVPFTSKKCRNYIGASFFVVIKKRRKIVL